MRVVAVADLHNVRPAVPDGDMLIVAGDLTERGSLEELVRMRDWLKTLPHKHKVVIAGNHDWCLYHENRRQEAELALGSVPGLRYLRDQGITIEGLNVYGSPWQPEFCNWAFNLDRGEPLRRVWSKIPPDLDILVTHGPPSGYGDLTTRGLHAGCGDLLAAIDVKKPRYTFFGHIHEGAGQWDRNGLKIINCTVGDVYGSKAAREKHPRGQPVVLDIIPPDAHLVER